MALVLCGVEARRRLPVAPVRCNIRHDNTRSPLAGEVQSSMSTLLCLGLGYCAEHYVAQHGARFARVVGTTRTAERAAALAAGDPGGRTVEVEAFDGVTVSDALRAAAGEADALLVSAAPDEGGDPVLRA